MRKHSNHVVRNTRGGWSVKKEGSDKAQRVFNTQKEAIDYAVKLSKEEKNEVVVHSANGRISSKDSYAKDPHPPTGRGRRKK